MPYVMGTIAIRTAALPSTDRKSTRLNSSHRCISYAVFCLEKTIRTGCRRTRNSGARTARSLVVVFAWVGWIRLNDYFGTFFNDTAPTEIYPLPLHDAPPI